MQKVIDSPMLGRWINNMRWAVLEAENPKFTLLTSDRPVIMTNGLNRKDSQIILPISPWHVFVATNTERTERRVKSIFAAGQMIPQVNERVALQAQKYIYGFSHAQFNFVKGRLGQRYPGPGDNLPMTLPEDAKPESIDCPADPFRLRHL